MSLPTATSICAITGDFLCPRCGYNLRGLTQDRCPECGSTFDRATLSDSQLPWVHRRHRGRLRAYWRTVWQITWHPESLAGEFCRPVSYAHSQSFRWFTIFWAWLPLAFSTLLFLGSGDEDQLRLGHHGMVSDVWLAIGFHAAVVLALAALTGVPSYFFHPRRLPVEYQNRGVALSYYACAPLAWAPVVYVVGGLVNAALHDWMLGSCFCLTLTAMQLLLWWRGLAKLVDRILRQRAGSTDLPYLVVPLAALLASAFAFTAVAIVTRYFGLLCFSLRG